MKRGHDHEAGRGRWALFDRQFDLVRTDSGETYLTRWWLVDTPIGGLALHRMTAGDARDTVHTHPFSFVAIPIVGGYFEKRLDPRTMRWIPRHVSLRRLPKTAKRVSEIVQTRVNVVRVGLDAHTVVSLDRVPTYTLLLIGPQRGTWGFLEPDVFRDTNPRPGYGVPWWRWTRHDKFDSGHYAPERADRRR